MKPSGDQFRSREIKVRTGRRPGVPEVFWWQGREYRVREIWGEWPDFGFGTAGKGRWWQRRHRTYFRVVTEGEEVFEIYLDRGSRRKRWFLYRCLGTSSDSASGPAERG